MREGGETDVSDGHRALALRARVVDDGAPRRVLQAYTEWITA